jgi:hypothetical protein
MLAALFFSSLLFVAVMIGVVAVPVLVVGTVVWLIILPFKLLFGGLLRLIFGVGGALLGLLIGPLVMAIVGVALMGAFVAALLALLVPLVPVVLLVLLGWGVVKAASRGPQATGLS